MTKGERTRHYIIEKTAPLFNMKGFEGTSLSDLIQATGLTKGSLYGNFHDKQEIARAAFEYSIKKVQNQVRARLEDKRTNKEKLLALLSFYEQYVLSPPVPGGCPLLNTAIEADDHYTEMRTAVAQELKRVIEVITNLLEEGQLNDEFKQDFEAADLAYTFFCAVEGAIMFSRVSTSRKAMKAVINHCKKILDQKSK
jgi:AcrR family transcriptional regulator